MLVALFLTVYLSGSISATNILIINGESHIADTYATRSVPSVGYDENFSNWIITSSSSSKVASLIRTPDRLLLSGAFLPSSSPSAVLISKDLFVNITRYPLFYLKINLSQGVAFGVRFAYTVDGQTRGFYRDSDSLNHRYGRGEAHYEANIQLLAKSNVGIVPTNVTGIQIYVERPASQSRTNFTLSIKALQFLTYGNEPPQSTQSKHSFVFSLDSLPALDPSWSLNKANIGLQISADPGSTFGVFVIGEDSFLSSSRPVTYSQVTSNFEFSLYQNKSQGAFLDSLPARSGYLIAVVAFSGAIRSVTVQSAVLEFARPSMPIYSISLSARELYSYLMFFIFLLPVSMSLFLYQKYRIGKLSPPHIALVVAVGLACRLALAPMTYQPFDTIIFATSARGWFGAGVTNASLGPTLPLTFVLYWIPYSFYALMLKAGFHDFYVLGHQVGFVETAFIKGFPIVSDLLVFYFLLKFNTQQAGRLFASFYLLNPLAIYISAVWGQYEASGALFIVIGFLLLSHQGVKQEVLASLAFVASSIVELFGLIPLVLLIIRRSISRPFKPLELALLATPLALLAAYFSQTSNISAIFASVIGASVPLSVGQPTVYTIVSKFPQVAPFHPLIVLSAVVTIVFVVRRNYDLRNIVLYTIFAFLIFLFFAGQQPQYWVVILPLGLTYALISKNYAVGYYMLTLGAFVAFLTLSYTQGSGFMLFGDARRNLFPALENVPRGIYLYTIPTAIGAIGMLGYLIMKNRVIGSHPIILSALFLLGTFVSTYFLTKVL